MKRVNLSGFRQAECVQPTPAAAVVMWIYILIISVDFWRKLFTFFHLRGVCVYGFSPMIYIISALYFFFPHGKLFSSLYHIIMPKGAWACGHVYCLSVCFREVLSERFTSKKDTVKDKVRVHVCALTKCLWICVCVGGCVHCWVCVVLIASGDCQVGYRETVMTALLLPGWPPTRCTRLTVTAMMC